MAGKKSQLRIGGKTVPVSNLEKVFYPASGFTKADVVDYYIRIAPVLLPHLKGRSLTLKRYPDGVEGGFFYEKECPGHRPGWIKTNSVFSKKKEAEIHHCMIEDVASLVWAANLADLELHTFLWRGRDTETPTMLVFDLDPGPPAGILDCAEAALRIRKLLGRMGLELFPKTSGSKGLQVYLPLNSKVSFDRSGPFAKSVAQYLERETPKQIVSKMTKSLRKGKVFVDWSQNDAHKTTVCVYSLRAKERPTVSTPLRWSEVEAAHKKGDPERLVFDSKEVCRRAKKMGDLFAPVLKIKQKLPRAFET